MVRHSLDCYCHYLKITILQRIYSRCDFCFEQITSCPWSCVLLEIQQRIRSAFQYVSYSH